MFEIAITLFLSGLFSGIILMGGIFFMLLSTKEKSNPDSANEFVSSSKTTERVPNATDMRLFKEALDQLDELKLPSQHVSSPVRCHDVWSDQDALSLEKHFTEGLREAKERERQVKAIATFFVELGKVFGTSSRELQRLATISVGHVTRPENEHFSDKWWLAISQALEHLASDHESLHESLQNDVAGSLINSCEEHTMVNKRLNGEGAQLISTLKECASLHDSRLKERDKCQDAMDRGPGLSIGGNDTDRKRQKLTAAKRALTEIIDREKGALIHFSDMMPRVLADFDLMKSKVTIDVEVGLQKFANKLDNSLGKTSAVTQRLRSHIEHGFEVTDSGLGKAVGALSVTLKGIAEGQNLEESSASTAANLRLDLSTEASAILAATSLAQLPPLPAVFNEYVGAETCIWFNAFAGRIYRDIGKSMYFYHWFCGKTSVMLNKGKKPDFIDAFVVIDVKFGALPPLISNMRWSPGARPRPKPTFDPNNPDGSPPCNGSGSTSGAAEGPGSPGGNSATGESSGIAGAVGEEGASSPAAAGEGGEGAAASGEQEGGGSEGDDGRTDYDVECTGEVTFRSGITMKIATKIWCNWPRDRYASIPIVLTLEIQEISGRVRFGVERSCSYVSFLEEPYTRFKVHSEVGSDQFKFKDLPQLSSFVVKKMKEIIRKRFVHPNSHKFRLIWPRTWWPDGTEDLFLPTPLPFQMQGGGDGAAVPGHTSAQKSYVGADGSHTEGGNAAVTGAEGAISVGGADTATSTPTLSSESGAATDADASKTEKEGPKNLKDKISNWFGNLKSVLTEPETNLSSGHGGVVGGDDFRFPRPPAVETQDTKSSRGSSSNTPATPSPGRREPASDENEDDSAKEAQAQQLGTSSDPRVKGSATGPSPSSSPLSPRTNPKYEEKWQQVLEVVRIKEYARKIMAESVQGAAIAVDTDPVAVGREAGGRGEGADLLEIKRKEVSSRRRGTWANVVDLGLGSPQRSSTGVAVGAGAGLHQRASSAPAPTAAAAAHTAAAAPTAAAGTAESQRKRGWSVSDFRGTHLDVLATEVIHHQGATALVVNEAASTGPSPTGDMRTGTPSFPPPSSPSHAATRVQLVRASTPTHGHMNVIGELVSGVDTAPAPHSDLTVDTNSSQGGTAAAGAGAVVGAKVSGNSVSTVPVNIFGDSEAAVAARQRAKDKAKEGLLGFGRKLLDAKDNFKQGLAKHAEKNKFLASVLPPHMQVQAHAAATGAGDEEGDGVGSEGGKHGGEVGVDEVGRRTSSPYEDGDGDSDDHTRKFMPISGGSSSGASPSSSHPSSPTTASHGSGSSSGASGSGGHDGVAVKAELGGGVGNFVSMFKSRATDKRNSLFKAFTKGGSGDADSGDGATSRNSLG